MSGANGEFAKGNTGRTVCAEESSPRAVKDQIAKESMSLEQYNNLMESLFIEADKHYHNRLLKSKAQLEQGDVLEKSIDELDALVGVE